MESGKTHRSITELTNRTNRLESTQEVAERPVNSLIKSMFDLIQLYSKKFTSHSIFFHIIPVALHASHSVGTVVTDTMHYC